ncbi:hypothetical protein ACJMK2_033432 [Sinanodonta woodiana]|uniref:tRNA-dihydrouridine(16/17) synthase [NAD(P)(+)]-like n=1 Tax=Sinanodonta woodiana TaxID=1069815 RepID=A0ABD3WQ64_SINWO
MTHKKMEKHSGFKFWRTKLKSCKFIVAPMVDQSELAWRMLSRRYGAELGYTPMLHSSVFIRDERYRQEGLQSCPEDRPLIAQFCGNDPETFLKAAKLAEDHCDAVDINLGCPQSIAKRGHYGAFLEDEWDLIARIISLCHKELKVPITAKIRVFESIEKTVQYAKMLEKAGCQLLAVHGRRKEQKGKLTCLASWEHIKAVKENVSIPVFANGNIQYLPDVERCLKETGADGVMSAEGNLHNPSLFTGLNPPIWQMAEEYLDLVEKYPCPIPYIRGHIFKLFHHALHLHHDIRDIVAVGQSLEEFRKATQLMKERCQLEMANPEIDGKKGLYGELPLPYWICQPYVRPSPEEEEKNREKREQMHLKRTLVFHDLQEGADKLSKKKMKKQMRNIKKNFDPSKKIQYDLCTQCCNPKGQRCSYELCKKCCKRKAYTENLDCPGHNILCKTKAEQRKAATEDLSSDIQREIITDVQMVAKMEQRNGTETGHLKEQVLNSKLALNNTKAEAKQDHKS